MECQLENIAVHYRAFGEGRPIVFLHGGAVDHRFEMNDYEAIFERRAGWRRIYPDLPGCGRTPGADWITDQDGVLQAVLDFIDAVIPGQRFAVAGSSLGGLLARGVVYHRAAWLDGLLLRVPLIEADDARRSVPPRVVLVEDSALAAEVTPEEASGFALAVVQSRAFLDKIRTDSVPARRLADFAFLDRISRGPNGVGFSFDVDALPEPFAAPTLIVTGRQDALVGYRDAWAILENYPRATFAVLDRAGHILPVEQAELFSALVNDWLDRVEEWASRV